MTPAPHRTLLLSTGVLLLLAPMLAMANEGVDGGTEAIGEIRGRVTSPLARIRENVVVYLEHADGDFPPPREAVVIDQHGLHFHPRVLPILVGTEVQFLNHDSVSHNVYSPDHETYDLGVWGDGEHRSRRFRHLGVYRQLCHLHPDMQATILVLQNPYFTLSGADGSFRIQHVPEGDHVLKFWSESAGETSRAIHVRGGRTTHLSLRLHSHNP